MKTPMNDKEELIKEIKATPLNDIEYIQIVYNRDSFVSESWYKQYIVEEDMYAFVQRVRDKKYYMSCEEMADYIRKINDDTFSYIMVKYTKFKCYN